MELHLHSSWFIYFISNYPVEEFYESFLEDPDYINVRKKDIKSKQKDKKAEIVSIAVRHQS